MSLPTGTSPSTRNSTPFLSAAAAAVLRDLRIAPIRRPISTAAVGKCSKPSAQHRSTKCIHHPRVHVPGLDGLHHRVHNVCKVRKVALAFNILWVFIVHWRLLMIQDPLAGPWASLIFGQKL
ncbi:hypothetical protein CGRA01v4_13082 [Colletotrichum graminicola]|uniref:Uncharacterized protein n=1 Tax=Colletotrichum graminicola (strain M1.001 / M2 / FGSC 10212) TaxID=645133 RepID=E3QM23_COLGM|nr:uncharacterized protein GLRG_07055 [Colletotrichum graminicola M1.001]EFQ31911.1 hypothetical protein GLRG_07055 [Colletotrichum graminicola M1.001]WDK21792.1 hypothetical protein CGRA01v4_13082 [Colletotrichum graminicola]